MILFSRIALAALLLSAPASAQTPQSAAKTPGNLKISGDLTYRANGVRLEANARGAARVTLPQLDVTARAIALDTAGDTISQVRALNNVNFKLNLTPSGGGAPARIEATCDSAVLTPRPLKLELKGNLKGFYQIAGGARNTLSGDLATFTNPGGNLLATLTGGVTLVVPAETAGRPDTLGTVTISAQRAQINQSDGSATFAGNARAISKGGTNNFDVAAPRFTLTRQADGTISTLQAIGRTMVKLDLPPDSTPATPSTDSATNPQKINVAAPTHVEVAADGAIIERATSTATFNGNVKGFYRLIQNGAPQNYDFAGSKAVIRYAPTPGQDSLAAFSLDVSGATVEGPAFNLGF